MANLAQVNKGPKITIERVEYPDAPMLHIHGDLPLFLRLDYRTFDALQKAMAEFLINEGVRK
jgi:hypothetical protein